MKRRWQIYIGDSRKSQELGQPMLGIVVAETKEEAERLAALDPAIKSPAPASGYWAVPIGPAESAS